MSNKTYLSYIDGLRAVAVISVVLYHCGVPLFRGGFVGVDVFFVISGFLITQLLATELESTGTLNVAAFFARRMRRLFPSLLFVLFCTLILAALVLSPTEREVQEVGRAAIATSLFTSNFYFAWWLQDYFAGPSEFQPLLHTWSLSVEEQFYLVWPFLLWLASGAASLLNIPFRRAALTAIIATILASFVGAIGYRSTQPELVFFWTAFRAWEFGLGAVLALLPGSIPSSPRLANGLASAGLVAIGASVAFLAPGAAFPVPAAILPTFGTGLIILAYKLRPHLATDRLLTAGPMRWLGRLSYAWYLWHFPLLAIAKLRLLEQDPIRDAAIALFSLLLADVTVRFVERPLRFGLLPRLRNPTVLGSGAACSLGLVGLALSVGFWAQSIALAKPPGQGDQVVPASVPEFGAPPAAAESRLFIMGDSHAGHLMEALKTWTAEQHNPMNTTFLLEGACLPVRGVIPVIAGHKNPTCALANEENSARIRDSAQLLAVTGRQPQIAVVLAARWTIYIGKKNVSVYEPWVGHLDADGSGQTRAIVLLKDRLTQQIAELAAQSIRVILVLSPPELKFHLGKCLERLSAEKCAPRRSAYLEHQAEIRAVASDLAKQFPDNVRIFDPIEILCPQEVCDIMIDGQKAYIDSNHLSGYGSLALLPGLVPLLDWAFGRAHLTGVAP